MRRQKREPKSSSSSAVKNKKKKKKDKVRGEVGAEGAPVRVRLGGKTSAKKTLDALYLGTGLDPNYKSSEESTTDLEDDTLLHDRSKVHCIAEVGPGILAAQSVENTKKYLTQPAGSGWELDSKSIPALLSLCNRTYLAPRLTGGVARECTTLAHVADLPLQARPAEAVDAILQRMKSIEMVANGTAWATGNGAEVGDCAAPGCHHGHACRVSSSSPRSQARQRGQGKRPCRQGKGQEQRERKRKGKRERQRKRKGDRGKEKLIREDVPRYERDYEPPRGGEEEKRQVESG